jgi:hypothetical protein
MTQDDKDLLLKDLCSRLPYGVKGEKYTIRIDEEFVPLIDNEIIIAEDIITLNGCPGYMIRPYLFPLSSMTEEQLHDFYCRFVVNEIDYADFKHYYFECNRWNKIFTTISDCVDVIDWFNKNNFDYRGLIPMGLAIDATNKDIY